LDGLNEGEDNMPRLTGEITLDSPFGKALTACARLAKTMVEVGTGSGLGSTQCLLAGVRDEGQKVYTYEGDEAQYVVAVNNLKQFHSVTPFLGIFHRTIRPYYHPVNSIQHREMWDYENNLRKTFSLREWPEMEIDLLLLDGGEFTSLGDFLMLWDRSKVIALDDIDPYQSVKNCSANAMLSAAGWKMIAFGNDRHGWAIFEKP
jgi:hypothetical protein